MTGRYTDTHKQSEQNLPRRFQSILSNRLRNENDDGLVGPRAAGVCGRWKPFAL